LPGTIAGRDPFSIDQLMQRWNDRSQRPIGDGFADRLFQTLDTLAGLSLGLQQLLQDETLLAIIKLQIGKPGAVPRIPGLEARIVPPQTQQHRRDLLALAR
jgi:hypothetical protein